jgi:hypothetical protein
MATEINLSPGWLLKDVRLAAERLEPSQRQLGDKAPDSNNYQNPERHQHGEATESSSRLIQDSHNT